MELTNQDIDSFDLPHSAGSLLIKFCHFALKPYMSRTETGTGALSEAWKRFQDVKRPQRVDGYRGDKTPRGRIPFGTRDSLLNSATYLET